MGKWENERDRRIASEKEHCWRQREAQIRGARYEKSQSYRRESVDEQNSAGYEYEIIEGVGYTPN